MNVAKYFLLFTSQDPTKHRIITFQRFPLSEVHLSYQETTFIGQWIMFMMSQARNKKVLTSWRDKNHHLLGPIHTNPFSNKNGAVLLCFQRDLRPHLSFSYRFRQSTLQWSSREKPHGTVCSPFWILTVKWASARSCLFGWRHRFQIASFSPSTLETFSKSIFFTSLHSGERFRMTPFSVINFGVAVWTIAVSRAKQLCFCLKTD